MSNHAIRRGFFTGTLFSIVVLLNGCAFINFSGNYYTLPPNYHDEITQTWNKLNAQIPFKYQYAVRIISGKDADRLNGVPAISEKTILLPDAFVKYVYQNYYDDRFKVFMCVMVHEASHAEFDLPTGTPELHFQTDVKAIGLLGADSDAPEYFYKALYVMKDYWFARKGVAGHTVNAAWNALNLVSMTLGGPGMFIDLYGTDLNKRMALITKTYGLRSRRSFKRSHI